VKKLCVVKFYVKSKTMDRIQKNAQKSLEIALQMLADTVSLEQFKSISAEAMKKVIADSFQVTLENFHVKSF
jgi:hypothetical protein